MPTEKPLRQSLNRKAVLVCQQLRRAVVSITTHDTIQRRLIRTNISLSTTPIMAQQTPQSPELAATHASIDNFSSEFRQNMNTKIVPARSKLVPGTFKTEPCWKHLLDFKKKKSIHHKCATKDETCEGQHPEEHRELIDELRAAKGFEPLSAQTPIFGYLSMEDQDRVLDEYMVSLGWKAVHPIHAHAALGERMEGGTVKDELKRLEAENQSLREQVEANFDKYAGNYDKDPHKMAAQLMTRNAILETELENYQKYMRQVTKSNLQERQKLERKIKELKRQMRRDSTAGPSSPGRRKSVVN